MAISGIQNPLYPSYTDPASVWQRRRRDTEALVSAVNRGDTQAAQAAVTKLQADVPSLAPGATTVSPSGDTFMNSLQKLFQAVQSGDLNAARQALGELLPPSAQGYGPAGGSSSITSITITIQLGVPASGTSTTSTTPATGNDTSTATGASGTTGTSTQPTNPLKALFDAIKAGDMTAAQQALQALQSGAQSVHGHHGHHHHHHHDDTTATTGTDTTATATTGASGASTGATGSTGTTTTGPHPSLQF